MKDRNFQNMNRSDWYDGIPNYGWDYHYAGGRYFPQETSGPFIPNVVPSGPFIPNIVPLQPPKPVIPYQTSGMNIPTVAQPRQPKPVVKHQTSRPTPSLAQSHLRQSKRPLVCEICDVMLSSHKVVEGHRNGRRHQEMLRLHKESQSDKTSNMQFPKPQMDLVTQPKTGMKSEKNISSVKNLSSEADVAEPKKFMQKDKAVPSEAQAHGTQGKPKDETDVQGCGIKRKIGETTICKTILKSEKNRCSVKKVSSEATVAKPKNYVQKDSVLPSKVPAQGPQQKPKDSTGGQGCGIKRKIEEATTGKTVHQSEKVRGLVKKVSQATVAKPKNYVQKDLAVPSKVPVQGPQVKLKDSTGIQRCSIKPETGGATIDKTPLKSEKNICSVENVSPGATVSQPKNYVHKDIAVPSEVPAQGPQRKPKDNTGVLGCGIKLKSEGATIGKYIKTNNGLRKPMESSKPDVNALSNSVESLVQIPALAPSPVEGSSFKLQVEHVSASQAQVSEDKEHLEIQNPSVELNDQPQSISVKLHASAGSNINTQTEDVSSDSAVSKGKEHFEIQNPSADDQPLSISVDLHGSAGSNVNNQTEDVSSNSAVLKCKEHLKIQNPSVETNDQPQSISEELHASAGSNVNAQTEDVSSDSAVIVVTPAKGSLASDVFVLPPIVGSSFESNIQPVLHTETEPQVSEIIAHCERKNPTDETNVELLSSALVEFNAPSGSSTDTQTVNGSYEANEKKDVPNTTTELGITHLSQVTVCLQCGDKGFPETLVFCKGCKIYGLHRYCLDGPVIFTDDVTWFCEDCEVDVVDNSHDHCALLPSGENDIVNPANDESQAGIDPTNCIERVEENKQPQQSIAAKTKDLLLSDGHNSPHHEQSQRSKDFKEAMVEKEFQFVLQPITDPSWRGSLCLSNRSFDTFSGLLAHLSNLACPKAQEETRLLPEVLCVDLIERSEVWPKTFMDCGLDDNSIALFFFPESESAEGNYDNLVDDMIALDLAMRAVTENAELLVFPSVVLPALFRRFKSKYYMWGVFKATKTPSETSL